MGIQVGETNEYLPFEESKKFQKLLKRNGALQISLLLEKCSKFEKGPEETLKFGTETETHLLSKVTIDDQDYFPVSVSRNNFISEVSKDFPGLDFKGEFAAWMVEILPLHPFKEFLNFEEIRDHFFEIQKMSSKTSEIFQLISGLSCLPHLGTLHYFHKENNVIIPMNEREVLNEISSSKMFLDQTVSSHARYKSSVINKIARMQHKTIIKLPIYKDVNSSDAPLILDHVGFGTGSAALQVTFSCRNLSQARWAYDQLHILSPFFLILSSSTFAIFNTLIDSDCRFQILQQACEDRSPAEMKSIPKSRFGVSNYFISENKKCKNMFNDAKYVINKSFAKTLRKLLMKKNPELAKDRRLINHFSYLFVRDYLTVFSDRLIKDNTEDTIEFEIMQSTNWQTMRLKPPPDLNSDLGWLLEFRCMDCPITEKEKSALIFLATLFMRIITDPELEVDFYIKISEVDANFEESFKREALTKGRLMFRKHFCKLLDGVENNYQTVILTVAEFFEGNHEFLGMKRLFQKFIEINYQTLVKSNAIVEIWRVYDFFLARSKGEIIALPEFGRNFVLHHSSYAHDSCLNDKIIADLMAKIIEIQNNNGEPSMFGDFLHDNI
jgi:glutamate--cysteine ligase catalytic subunit